MSGLGHTLDPVPCHAGVGGGRSFTDYLMEAVGLSPLWACRTRSTTILVMSIRRSGTSLPRPYTALGPGVLDLRDDSPLPHVESAACPSFCRRCRLVAVDLVPGRVLSHLVRSTFASEQGLRRGRFIERDQADNHLLGFEIGVAATAHGNGFGTPVVPPFLGLADGRIRHVPCLHRPLSHVHWHVDPPGAHLPATPGTTRRPEMPSSRQPASGTRCHSQRRVLPLNCTPTSAPTQHRSRPDPLSP